LAGRGGRGFEELYSFYPWPEDYVEDPRAKSRFEEARAVFDGLLEHGWLKSVVEGRERVRVVDVCGGTGLAGAALCLSLRDRGVDCDLVVNDVRRDALEKARRLVKRVVGIEPRVVECDARELHRCGLRFDVALVWGFTMPHFSPFDAARLLASVAASLESHGLLLIEERDHVYTALRSGWREVVVEAIEGGRAVVSLYSGYNVFLGVFKRMVLELPTARSSVMDFRLWDVASLAAIAWLLFEDVDFVVTKSPTIGVLMAWRPRGIDPESLAEETSIERRGRSEA